MIRQFGNFFQKREMSFEHGLQFVMFDYLNRYKAKNLDEMMAKFRLSPREIEVCKLILKGLQTKEIADRLFISYDTSRNHHRNIYTKCKVQNKVELVNKLNNIYYED